MGIRKSGTVEPMDDISQKSSDQSSSIAAEAAHNSLDRAMQATLRPVQESLKRIEKRLNHHSIPKDVESDADDFPGNEAGPPTELDDVIDQAFDKNFARFESRLAEFRDRLLSELEHPETDSQLLPDSSSEPTFDSQKDVWQMVFLGDHLCTIPEIADVREQLLDDILNGDSSASVFAAQMMLVQAASTNDLPEVLKQVGEAYYQWRPRTDTEEEPFETALAAWLTRQAEAAGLPNSIQLVRLGERFERTRHVANGRGVEVVAVHGWVILRDGGKVYTRASVSVK